MESGGESEGRETERLLVGERDEEGESEEETDVSSDKWSLRQTGIDLVQILETVGTTTESKKRRRRHDKDCDFYSSHSSNAQENSDDAWNCDRRLSEADNDEEDVDVLRGGSRSSSDGDGKNRYGCHCGRKSNPTKDDDDQSINSARKTQRAAKDSSNGLVAFGLTRLKLLFCPNGMEISSLCCSRTTWLAIFLGQMLSGILCVSAITSVYLTDLYNIHVPNAQNFAFYIMLSGVFTTILACRPAERNLFPVLKMRGWKYALVALADAEANFLVVKAYQLTTLTSVQLLDCFSIPTVLSLSWLVLRIRYKVAHILGVSICLLGVCCLVWADIEEGRAIGPGKDRFLGDMLCLSGAFLYGVSNVAQEFVVKTFDVVEFLGMVGLFGSFVTGAQTVLLEYSAVTEADWAGPSTPLLLLLGFAAAQFSFYFLAAIVIKLSGATAYNMSILTADFYSLIVGIYLFQYKFHALYFLSFVLVMTGVIVFSIKPTLIASDIYRSLTREHTTTVDLELMASTPPPSFPFQTPSGGSCGVSGTTGLMENSSLIGDSPRLSNSSCDVVMQTTGAVSNHVRRNDRGCYKENKHVYEGNGQTYMIPEDEIC